MLPDDPRALMMATFDRPLARVAQKMAASGNTAFIPVLVDFLRFQTNNEGISSLASFLVRIKDGVPEGEPVLFGPEQSEWSWWMEWLGNHPEVQPPDGYAEWKGLLFSVIDPEMGAFLYDDVKSSIRIEEIVWGRGPQGRHPRPAIRPGNRCRGSGLSRRRRAGLRRIH